MQSIDKKKNDISNYNKALIADNFIPFTRYLSKSTTNMYKTRISIALSVVVCIEYIIYIRQIISHNLTWTVDLICKYTVADCGITLIC